MGTAKRERQKANRQARLEAAREEQRKAATRKRTYRFAAIVAAAVVGSFVLWLVVNNGDDQPVASDSAATASTGPSTPAGRTLTGATPCPKTDGSEERVAQFQAPPPNCIDATKTYTVTFNTSAGQIKAKLDTSRTPNTANNFVVLARYKYYDGSTFFRTDPSIGIIQGGGLTNTDNPGYTITDEGGKFEYSPGDLVMARGGAPNSGGGQFFFAVDDKTGTGLNAQGTYVTFAKVTEGMDVLTKILASHKAQADNPLGGVPDPAVTVSSVTVEES